MIMEDEQKSFMEKVVGLNRKLYSFCLGKTGEAEAARDLSQEILLKAFRFQDRYSPELPFLPWFWTLARNVARDWNRRWGDLKREDFPEQEEWERLGVQEANADLRLDARSQRARLVRALRALSRPQRRVAWLFYVRDLTYAEIAERLGMTLGSVKCLAQRARVALKRAWEAEGKQAFATT